MAPFRLQVLVCVAALACSGADEVDPADTSAAGSTSSNPATSSPASSGMRAGSSASGAAPGMPGLDAPSDVAAPPSDAEFTASGLASKRLVAGTGTRSPRATDTVRVHYTGWRTDGMRFDSSVDGIPQPLEFPLNMVIAGWTEGLQLMVEGEERRLWIPEALAYRGQPNRPAGMLVFDVQLLAILP